MESIAMNSPNNLPRVRRGILSARRFALLATAVAGLSAFALVGPSTLSPYMQGFSAAAQTPSRPAGFADIVAKVKPSVISVRVKMTDDTPRASNFSGEDVPVPPGSPFEFFF